MNLDELRQVVRVQTQTTSGELPDATIDTFLQQGFERTINAETQWPFYEQTWDLVLPANEMTMTLPGDVNLAGIMALHDSTNNFRLQMVGGEFAADAYAGPQVGTMSPAQFTIWGNTIYAFPAVQASTVDRNYRLRGYRRPLVWLTPGNEPDCDARLHMPLTHYAVALAYAQQEDETLETVYMDRWQRDVEMAHSAIMEPRHHRPLVLNGSIYGVPRPANAWTIERPVP